MERMNYVELDWRVAMILGSAMSGGLLHAVGTERRTSEEVAGKLSLDFRAVHTLLAALAELRFLDEHEGTFVLRDEHRTALLDEEAPGYVGGQVLHRFGLMQSWARLPEILRTGEPVEDRTRPAFSGTAQFIQAMRHAAREGTEDVTRVVLSLLPEGAHILDVGGGPGTNAESFAAGGARVTVFDRPEVIELMHDTLSAAGIETAEGDMNEELPAGPFDAIYFGNTSHMYGPEENRELFASMRRSLKPGGLLLIREYVRGMSEDAALFAVNMLVLTPRGGTYTAGEYREWLRGAGFEDLEVRPILGRTTSLVVARNPA
jgi:SAM-dependent methyltransferase